MRKGSIVELVTVSLNFPEMFDGAELPGGTIIANGMEVSPMFRGQTVKIAPFLIGRKEISLAEFHQEFPGYPGTSINFEMAVAFAERKGCGIPTIYEYFYAVENLKPGSGVTGLDSGLREWTETPIEQFQITVLEYKPLTEADIDSRCIVGSKDHLMEDVDNDMRTIPIIQNDTFNKFWNSFTTYPNTGFRLIKRLKPN